MTRTDVMASSRPGTGATARPTGIGSRTWSMLSLVSVLAIVAVGLMAPAGALAAGSTSEATSGYNQEPAKPSTGTSPSKETTTPTTTTPETSTAPSSEAKTLPFTGFDVRLSLAVGVLLMGAGCSIIVLQRRRQSSDRS